MGMQRTVRFDSGGVPAWDAIRTQLGRVGVTAGVKMIDGLPAFPDEVPEPGWSELRVGTSGGMVTLRTGPNSLTCVVWGNSDDALRTAWNSITWACAAAGSGQVEAEDGWTTADEFARRAGLVPS